MGDLEDFRSGFLAKQAEAEAAMVHGDVEPRLALWSRRHPVSLPGALGPNKTGWDELHRLFVWIAERLGGTEYANFRFDIEVADVTRTGRWRTRSASSASMSPRRWQYETVDGPGDARLPARGWRLEDRPPPWGSRTRRRESPGRRRDGLDLRPAASLSTGRPRSG